MLQGKNLDTATYEEVVKTIADVATASFVLRPMRDGHISEAECERRVTICGEVWNVLYGDLNWSGDRILDHLKPFLISILDGGTLADLDASLVPAERDTHTMWAPGKLGDLEPERRLSALAKDEPAIIGLKDGGKNGN